METQNQKLVRLLLQGRICKTRIAETCGVSRNKVIRWSQRLSEVGKDWETLRTLSDVQIDQMINPTKYAREIQSDQPDWELVEKELASGHVTMKRAYEEYRECLPENAKPISLSQFYEVLKARRKENNVEMHFVYAPEEIVQFDFVGKLPNILFDTVGVSLKYDVAVAVS